MSSTRPPIRASHAAVSAGHPFAAEAALEVLKTGGNVVDAALAASGVASVVEPAWCGIGGDGFLLIHTAGGGTVAFNGSGRAPLGLAEDAIPGTAVPRFGPLSIAVPGLVDAWRAAAARYATRTLAELLAPAIEYARGGFAIYPRLARAIASLAEAPHPSPGLSALLYANDREVGGAFRQVDLATSLAAIAAGADDFYRGDLSRSLAAGLAARGAALGRQDLESHHAEWAEPLRVPYRGHQVLSHPLVSLGCVLLQELRILEGFDLRPFAPGDPRLVELEVAAASAAIADTDGCAGDPFVVDDRTAWLLSDERAAWWWGRIARGSAAPRETAAASGSDTTSIVVADAAGNVACVLQSLFNEWGSRELIPRTGVLLNDRLANVPVGGDRPNRLRPGKRPLHTLHAYLVTSNDEVVVAGATPGGRGQSQTNLQVLANIIDLGMDVQAAIDAPRWLRGLPRRGAEDRTVYLEPGLSRAVSERLAAAGHPVEAAPPGGVEPFGNCTVITRDPHTGTLLAGQDARRGSRAMGW